jgi:glycosyltransferase involved in cell wall biosynthesis
MEVSYVIDKGYLSLADFSATGEVISSADRRQSPGLLRFDIALFSNSSTGNRSLAGSMRARGASIFYLFHEPESIWNLGAEGWRQIVRFPFSTWFSIETLRLSSGVIVPSNCARAKYERYFLKYNPNVHTMPLLFDDEIGAARVQQERHKKSFFGFVGTACKSHNFDAFVAFAKHAIGSGSSIPFMIATKVDLSSVLADDKELAAHVNDGRILLRHARVLSNDEINECYLSCFCLWNVYRRSTQSGVLPRAFMAGSAVLASRIGSFQEYVQEGVTGEFVESASDCAAILRAAERIRNRAPNYVDGCRKMFLDTFYFKSNGDRFAAILHSARRTHS